MASWNISGIYDLHVEDHIAVPMINHDLHHKMDIYIYIMDIYIYSDRRT